MSKMALTPDEVISEEPIKNPKNLTREGMYMDSLREAVWASQRGSDKGVIIRMNQALEHIDGHGSVQDAITFRDLQLKLLENAHENWCLRMLFEAEKFVYGPATTKCSILGVSVNPEQGYRTTPKKNNSVIQFYFDGALEEAAYVKGINYSAIEMVRENCLRHLEKPVFYRWLMEKYYHFANRLNL